MEKMFLKASEIANIMCTSKATAYSIIRKLNAELDKKGMITIRGKVSRKYFEERTGIALEESN